MTPPLDAKCATHQLAATEVCARCGLFLCTECGSLSICGPCLSREAKDHLTLKQARDRALSSVAVGGLQYFFSGRILDFPGGQYLLLAIACAGFGYGVVALRKRGSARFSEVILPAVVGLVLNAGFVVVAVLLVLGRLRWRA